MKHIISALAVIFFAIMLCPLSAVAMPITFTHIGTASGSLDGLSFSISDFTITAIGDTVNRESYPGVFSIEHDIASIFIDGLGTLDFITPTRTFVSNSFPNETVGFSRAYSIGGSDLFDGPWDSVYATWDMLSSIGPHSGEGKILQWTNSPLIETDLGILILDDDFEATVTFQAVVGTPPIPAPAAIILGAIGTGFVGYLRKRRSI